ncbi:MAG: hypothetical protein OQJ89_13155 [Kangiellaceae bacterium]|nr:hypothetical protein [Kangiellaceae bacterium]MCW9017912.1 hypothetical protein [Kangiellaceae bacterium]
MNKKTTVITSTLLSLVLILNMGIIFTPDKRLKLEVRDISESRAKLFLWRGADPFEGKDEGSAFETAIFFKRYDILELFLENAEASNCKLISEVSSQYEIPNTLKSKISTLCES